LGKKEIPYGNSRRAQRGRELIGVNDSRLRGVSENGDIGCGRLLFVVVMRSASRSSPRFALWTLLGTPRKASANNL
ncbi:MAG: hypothetical protein ACREQC_02280, partial [Candidatus Binataceae bacterium]